MTNPINFIEPKDRTTFFVEIEDKNLRETSWSDLFRSFSNQLNLSKRVNENTSVKMSYIRPVNDEYPIHALPWNNDAEPSSGLCVFVHGLNSTPWCWGPYLSDIEDSNKEKGTNFHSFAPLVNHDGNCTLEEATLPFLYAINNYADKNPGKPIYLFGASNGGRIVAMLDRYIRFKNTKVKVISIAGAHFGSTTLDKIPNYFKKNLCPAVKEDLSYDSERTKKRLDLWRSFAKSKPRFAKRERLFFATTADTHIRPIHSALPNVGSNDHHYVVKGESHASITACVRPLIMQKLGF